jgi:hypothetical protein
MFFGCAQHGFESRVQAYKSRPKMYTLQVENTKLSTLKHRKYNIIFKKYQKTT